MSAGLIESGSAIVRELSWDPNDEVLVMVDLQNPRGGLTARRKSRSYAVLRAHCLSQTAALVKTLEEQGLVAVSVVLSGGVRHAYTWRYTRSAAAHCLSVSGRYKQRL